MPNLDRNHPEIVKLYVYILYIYEIYSVHEVITKTLLTNKFIMTILNLTTIPTTFVEFVTP